MMRPSLLLLAAAAVLSINAACRAAPTTAPATTQEAISPEVDKILTANEAAGNKITGLKAKMLYQKYTARIDETVSRDGSIRYLKVAEPGGPAGQKERVFFMIQFDTYKWDTGSAPGVAGKEIYSLHDSWLDELNYKTNQLIHRQVVPAGQAINPLKLGEGPFPVPFGQSKKDVLDNFTVKLIPPAPGDPKGADHLELTPRPGAAPAQAGKYEKLQLFVSRELNLPVRIVVEQGKDKTTADFTDIERNPSQSPDDFKLTNPGGFHESTEPLKK